MSGPEEKLLALPLKAEAHAALVDLYALLHRCRYERARLVPQPGTLRDLPLDAANLAHALSGGHNQFHASAAAPFYRAVLSLSAPGLPLLHRLFLLGETVARPAVEGLLGSDLSGRLLAAGVLEAASRGLRSTVMVSALRGGFYLSDALRLRSDPEFVYVGRSSFLVADLATVALDRRGRRGRVLDVGCGGGIIALAIAPAASEVVGSDIVPRCIDYASLNTALNRVANVCFVISDWFAAVEGEFDLIVANTPCGWADPHTEVATVYGTGGGDYGTELQMHILTLALTRLRGDGEIVAGLAGPVIAGRHHIVDALRRCLKGHEVKVSLYKAFEEYNYLRSRAYRREGIERTVRYVAEIRRAARFEVEMTSYDRLRVASYRARILIPRLVARLTGGPRPKTTAPGG